MTTTSTLAALAESFGYRLQSTVHEGASVDVLLPIDPAGGNYACVTYSRKPQRYVISLKPRKWTALAELSRRTGCAVSHETPCVVGVEVNESGMRATLRAGLRAMKELEA